MGFNPLLSNESRNGSRLSPPSGEMGVHRLRPTWNARAAPLGILDGEGTKEERRIEWQEGGKGAWSTKMIRLQWKKLIYGALFFTHEHGFLMYTFCRIQQMVIHECLDLYYVCILKWALIQFNSMYMYTCIYAHIHIYECVYILLNRRMPYKAI